MEGIYIFNEAEDFLQVMEDLQEQYIKFDGVENND